VAEEINNDEINNQEDSINSAISDEVTRLPGMYKSWFLDYASYVILERAVPHVNDGLKPVQRRILHSMKRMDDGRYNKVANIIGFTMQYHPHGDASIGDALTQLGQKDLLIDMQGNWGNILTGDSAAAPRYIEARLSKFALEVVFNAKTTEWKPTYDGRNNEPVHLPIKFPLLLAQGSEGIAVGLASKILPHNFIELIDASIAHLQHRNFELYPDFPTGGYMDASRYNDGIRGGKIRVRAKIEKLDKKTLVIREIPFGRTTSSLIESIVNATDKGKIKIKKIDDNTAQDVEIIIQIAPGLSPDQTIDALYAFTDCELSISPNSAIIEDDKPKFLGVKEILRRNTDNTLRLLKLELYIRLDELNADWHQSSLEKIFIENRIYNAIEVCETFEEIIEVIDKGLEPFKGLLRTEVTRDDIIRLTEIKIKRISRFDAFKADRHVKALEEEMIEVQHHIDHIVDYTINYYKEIKKKYSKGKERKTEIRNFDIIEAAQVVAINEKLYVNRTEGFIGFGLKKDEYIQDCSDIDDIIVFRKDGKFLVSKISEKAFVGKNILHAAIFKKNDERTIYNMVYLDSKTGNAMVKRFNVTSITRDKEYDLTKGHENSKVLYFSINPNGEAEKIKVTLKPKPRLRNIRFEFDFTTVEIRGRNSLGNILTRHAVHKIELSEKGKSTLGGLTVWFDKDVLRLNTDERGDYLGEFKNNDKILVVCTDGNFRVFALDLNHHFEDKVLLIEKFKENKLFTAVFYDADQGSHYVKRFRFEAIDKNTSIIGENDNSKLLVLSAYKYPRIEIKFGGANKARANEILTLNEFIGEKSFRARGKRLSTFEIGKVIELEPLIKDEDIEEIEDQYEDIDLEILPDGGESDDDGNENAEQEELDLE
jgi:topoisomerase-4 subunit A